jgi:hypothetical protein
VAEVEYHPNVGPESGLALLMRSPEMWSMMRRVGQQAANVASSYSSTPEAFTVTPTRAFGRWCVNVTNTAPDAIWQEFGTRRRTALAPLGRALVQLWSKDPNRRKSALARLLG